MNVMVSALAGCTMNKNAKKAAGAANPIRTPLRFPLCEPIASLLSRVPLGYLGLIRDLHFGSGWLVQWHSECQTVDSFKELASSPAEPLQTMEFFQAIAVFNWALSGSEIPFFLSKRLNNFLFSLLMETGASSVLGTRFCL